MMKIKLFPSLFAIALMTYITSSVYAELLPEAGPPGTTVTISGQDFGPFQSTQVNGVEFNGVPALIQLWEPDFIMVKVPLKATSGPVRVTNGQTPMSAGEFTIQQVQITRLDPPEAEAGSPLVIHGKHFGSTAGSRDPNTMFGVNQVLINGIRAEIRKWRPEKLEVFVPANATTGNVEVRLASSDPLPDGSCCAPVSYVVSNAMPLTVIPPVAVQPTKGPKGSKIVLSGQDFGEQKPTDAAVTIGGSLATMAQWSNRTIVVHVPFNAKTGDVVLHRNGEKRTVAHFEVLSSQIEHIAPLRGPIGTLVTIKGKNFGVFSEGGSSAYAFDFNVGSNGVEIGGVPAVIHRWLDNQIDFWIPFSAKNGPIVVKRGATVPNSDGTCCAKREVLKIQADTFRVEVPRVESYSPHEAGLDEIVTIKGSGFGEFLKISEATRLSLHREGHDWKNYELGSDVSRTEVLLNGIASLVVSWTDTEIRVRVPRRPVFGIGNPEGFDPDLTKGQLVVKRGSWDMLENGECCTPKKYVTAVGGPFTILKRGLPDPDYYNIPNPRRD
ncbi:MAG: IPT/TIG domain-containing protein [Nitrospirota bacterium]|nr:MAG: IPT/TIG domain-containing protein [Nitrospirota bacterium]